VKTGDRIVVTKEEIGYKVESGLLSEDSLCPEEALWCVVSLLTGSGRGFLRTEFEHAMWDARYGDSPKLLTAEKVR
jgi:hypothetical protein